MLVPTDQKEAMDHQVTVDPRALMANLEIRDLEDHPVQAAHQEIQETKVHLETQAKPLDQNQVHLVKRDLLANLANLDQLANLAVLARMAVQAAQAALATVEHLAAQAKLEMEALLEILAKMDHQAVASTAHLLVWLLVIKRRHPSHSGDTGHCEKIDFNINTSSCIPCHF